MEEKRKIVTITNIYDNITSVVSLTADQIKLLEYLADETFLDGDVTFEVNEEIIEI